MKRDKQPGEGPRGAFRGTLPGNVEEPRFESLPMSNELRRVLRDLDARRLDDIHHISRQELRAAAHGSLRLLNELDRLLHPPDGDVLNVADDARDIDPYALPLSLRAENLLKMLGVKKLGDLHGVSVQDLLSRRRYGARTVREIQNLLRRAEAGGFKVSPRELRKLSATDLLAAIDSMLIQVTLRNLEIITQRLGGDGGTPRTLGEVATRIGMTQERTRQVVKKTVMMLLRQGDPRIKAGLDWIERACAAGFRPLTLELLPVWVPAPWEFIYSPVFYIRLIAEMRPEIPVWVDGLKPGCPPGRMDEISAAVETVLESNHGRMPLAQAFEAVKAKARYLRTITRREFLSALRRSKRLKVVIGKAGGANVRVV
jgi:hypothetical protein